MGSRLETRRTCWVCGWAGGWTGAPPCTAARQSSQQSRGTLVVEERQKGRAASLGKPTGSRFTVLSPPWTQGALPTALPTAHLPPKPPTHPTCATRRRAAKLQLDAPGVVYAVCMIGVLKGEHILPVTRNRQEEGARAQVQAPSCQRQYAHHSTACMPHQRARPHHPPCTPTPAWLPAGGS